MKTFNVFQERRTSINNESNINSNLTMMRCNTLKCWSKRISQTNCTTVAAFSSCIKIDTLGLNGVYVSITNCAYVYCSYVRNHAVIGRQIISYEIL
ncbi:hypothetical protein T06_12212 [Trichinella sp. T6]|nr:hypothetical protein T06_12212 [Trichinella sp. T6]